ncbi:lysozyme family protein [Peribacillus frigoritolerans]|uniref:lysozyme family protein n=1 Tax=Peribacillus frigoritolerans TaxID=450367 RepID=UPI00207A80E7|nr:lysozyme family protein [Peribacillus frigoritolerans]USK77714.1 lysozyme family protein [Peribacillus frigoritolerans]
MYVKAALIAGKHWKKLILILMFMFTLIFMFFFGMEQKEDEFEYEGGGVATVSPLVLRYQPLVEKYAAKYGVESYVPLLLAKIMQESGGRVPDVMQSSESLGLPPNTIQDPERSIDVGIKYFSGILKKAKGDSKLALQSYNFGGGFIDYALKRGGYSKANAVAFSNMMAKKLGWDRYGDINYVDNVMRYLSGGVGGSAGPVNSFGFVKPIIGSITSNFGYRIHPITGVPKLHAGTDYSCGQKPVPIYATKSGKVIKAGWQDPNNHKAGYGQRIVIKHSDGLESVYAHLSKFLVKNGQTVTQGQQIGNCGTTGSSTGMHLHFELVVNGQKKDAAPYLN